MPELPTQRWHIASPDPVAVQAVAQRFQLDPLVAQVLINRGLLDPEQIEAFLDPTLMHLSDPLHDFADLEAAVTCLQQALLHQDPIAICGDYDADGMTSTALLLRGLRLMGGTVDYAIPSRMTEGYGINTRIVEEFAQQGIRVIITVDNGISAFDPVQQAKTLGMQVIITDHHDIPPQLPPADAILNPKLIALDSPYRGMAGVGVAYLLALVLSERLGQRAELERPLLELLTLGTIADLAPLSGINRAWVKQGLALLPDSQIPGIRALMAVIGLDPDQMTLNPEAIGFGLGPRINAVGRLAQPQVVIDLLTTEDMATARQRAEECEALNQQRQQLCREIEASAIEQIVETGLDPAQQRVLVLLGQDWHHGVIGIVASRLVERYGAPVFIASQAGAEVRGSARGIPDFNVFEALQTCADLFHKFGGHPAAGGFSMQLEHWAQVQQRLYAYAQQVLTPDHIQPLVKIDAQADLTGMNLGLFQALQQLQPFGISNPEPVFWSSHLRVTQQQRFGRDQAHLRFQVKTDGSRPVKVLGWGMGELHPLPTQIDLAYTLHTKTWRGEVECELEVHGIRVAQAPPDILKNALRAAASVSIEPSPDVPLGHSAEPLLPKRVPVKSPPLDLVMPVERDKGLSVPSDPDPATHSPPPLNLVYRVAPDISHRLEWHSLDRLSELLPTLRGTILLYGFRRPNIQAGSHCVVHYDRPQSGTHYDAVILWSWPPSMTHLIWLLAMAQPNGSVHQIYVYRQLVPLMDAADLLRQIQHFAQPDPVESAQVDIELLRLSQQWWISPSALVAGLRDLGYPCEAFPKTKSLTDELHKLERWFKNPVATVAAMLASSQRQEG